MTTIKTSRSESQFRLPDPPEREPDEMTSTEHLSETGSMHHLAEHLGNPDTTLVTGDHYISPVPTQNMTGVKYPDLLIAFDVDPELYYRSNAYIISEQGKPPDFVLEVASRHTRNEDTGEKREVYPALGIPEYWRFDKTGEFHGERLAGDRLVDGVYEPIEIEQMPEDILQGHSEVLNLNIRWHDGRLEWYDPKTGRHIATLADERAARVQAETRADNERAARTTAEARADDESAARVQAEARADNERAARTTAEARADDESAARVQAETRADNERSRADNESAARVQAETRAADAEARARELEEEFRRLRGG